MYKKQIIITIFFLITSFLVSAIPVEAKFSEDQFKSISTLLINNKLDFLNNGQTVPPVFIECTNGIHNQSPRVNSIQQANQVCRDTRNREQLLFNCIRRETTYSCANRVSASQVNQQPSGNVQQEQTRIRETSLNFAPQQFRFQERTFSGECSISNTMDNLAVCRRPDAGSQRYYGCVDSVDPLATVRFNCSVDKGIINTDVNSINDINISQSEFESLENQAFDPGRIGSPVTSSSATTTAGTVSYQSYTNFPGVGRISSLCQLITALWLLGFAVLLTSVLGMLLYGGYMYVTAGVNAGKVNQAKEIFTNTITGLIIGLSIFIIINIINPGLLQGNCSIPPIGSTGTGPVQPTLGGPGTSVPGNRNCDGCVSLRSQGVTVANWNGTNGPGRTDKVLPQVATATKKVQDEMASSGTPIHITAAWSNGVGHSSGSQHYQGLAVDIQSVSEGSRNNATLQQIANACRKAGFTFVLVESYHTHCDMR